MPRSCIKTLDTLDFGIPRSASSSHTVSHWALLIAACTRSTASGVLLFPGLPERGSLSTETVFEAFVPQFYLHCTHCIVPKILLNQVISMKNVQAHTKFDVDLLLYPLSHFVCNGHTVHMLTQWCLLPPLTSMVKSSLFTHAHSSPPSLAARLHWCHANCSHYISNGWTFFRQTSYFKPHY